MDAQSSLCQLGQLSAQASRLAVHRLLSDPDPYYGRQIVLRGYFVLEGVEMTALMDDHGQEHVLLSIRKLPARTAEQVLACRSKLVDVQGYLTHVPSHGGEVPILFANAIGAVVW